MQGPTLALHLFRSHGLLPHLCHALRRELDDMETVISTSDADGASRGPPTPETWRGSTSPPRLGATLPATDAVSPTPVATELTGLLRTLAALPRACGDLVEAGACGELQRLLACAQNVRHEAVSASVDALWSLLEASDRELARAAPSSSLSALVRRRRSRSAVYACGSLHGLDAVTAALERSLLGGHKASDKELRNELLALLSLIARRARARPMFVESGALSLLLLYSTAPELGLPTDAPPRAFATATDLDLEFKILAWRVVAQLCSAAENGAHDAPHDAPHDAAHGADVVRTVEASPLLQTLALYLRERDGEMSPPSGTLLGATTQAAGGGGTQLRLGATEGANGAFGDTYMSRWSPTQLHALQLAALDTLTALAPATRQSLVSMCLPATLASFLARHLQVDAGDGSGEWMRVTGSNTHGDGAGRGGWTSGGGGGGGAFTPASTRGDAGWANAFGASGRWDDDAQGGAAPEGNGLDLSATFHMEAAARGGAGGEEPDSGRSQGAADAARARDLRPAHFVPSPIVLGGGTPLPLDRERLRNSVEVVLACLRPSPRQAAAQEGDRHRARTLRGWGHAPHPPHRAGKGAGAAPQSPTAGDDEEEEGEGDGYGDGHSAAESDPSGEMPALARPPSDEGGDHGPSGDGDAARSPSAPTRRRPRPGHRLRPTGLDAGGGGGGGGDGSWEGKHSPTAVASERAVRSARRALGEAHVVELMVQALIHDELRVPVAAASPSTADGASRVGVAAVRERALAALARLCEEDLLNQTRFRRCGGVELTVSCLAHDPALAVHSPHEAMLAVAVAQAAVLGNRRSETRFLARGGAEALLELLDCGPAFMRPQLLACVADLACNPRAGPFLLQWRARGTLRALAEILVQLWREEEARRDVRHERGGIVLASKDRPLEGGGSGLPRPDVPPPPQQRAPARSGPSLGATSASVPPAASATTSTLALRLRSAVATSQRLGPAAERGDIGARLQASADALDLRHRLFAVVHELTADALRPALDPEGEAVLAYIERVPEFLEGAAIQDAKAELRRRGVVPVRADLLKLEHGLDAAYHSAAETKAVQMECVRRADEAAHHDESRFLGLVSEQRKQAAALDRTAAMAKTAPPPLRGGGVAKGETVEVTR